MEKVISIYREDGTAASYKLVSARIADFIAQYGPEKGYRIVSTSQDYLGYTQGRLQLALALSAQQALPEAEAIKLLENPRVLFVCQLLNSEGDIVAQASALKHVSLLKDHETGETAAFQRLMAKLGHGGEIFDYDERNDMNDQDLKIMASQAAGVTAVDASTPEPVLVPEKKESPVTTEKAKPTAANTSGTAQVDKTQLQPGLMRTLESEARIRKVKPNPVTTPAELKQELKRIRALPIPE